MKRIIVMLIITLLLVSAVFAQQYNDASDFDVGYANENSALVITDYFGKNMAVRIPPRIENLPVIAIWNEAFAGKGITSVTIPDGVLLINDGAFVNNNLTSITIPDSVIRIEMSAFTKNKLTSITIPNSVVYIGAVAFMGNNLTSINIPSSVKAIGDGAFRNNTITRITIGADVSIEPQMGIDVFDLDFGVFYIKNGKKAGTYTYSNGSWRRN